MQRGSISTVAVERLRNSRIEPETAGDIMLKYLAVSVQIRLFLRRTFGQLNSIRRDFVVRGAAR
ncbi:MAG: hypothetical protein ABJE47_25045 [bacterium]